MENRARLHQFHTTPNPIVAANNNRSRHRVFAVRASTVVMIAVAVGFGLLAVFVAQTWLNRQADMRARSLEAQKTPVVTRTIVVASQPLRFGTTLSSSQLREMPWPQDDL